MWLNGGWRHMESFVAALLPGNAEDLFLCEISSIILGCFLFLRAIWAVIYGHMHLSFIESCEKRKCTLIASVGLKSISSWFVRLLFWSIQMSNDTVFPGSSVNKGETVRVPSRQFESHTENKYFKLLLINVFLCAIWTGREPYCSFQWVLRSSSVEFTG